MQKFLYSFLTPALVFVYLLAMLMLLVPVQASAQVVAKDADKICVPPLTELNDDLTPETGNDAGDQEADNFKPSSNWVTFRWINRGVIQVIINPTGNCSSPSDLPMQYISSSDTSSGGLTKQLLEGYLRDSNFGDSDWDYREYGSGSSADEDTRLDNFADGEGLRDLVRDPLGQGTKIIDTNQLSTYLRTTQIVFSWANDEVDDDVANCRDAGDNDSNFILFRNNSKMTWMCGNSFSGSVTGISVGERFTDLANFNITYVVQTQGEVIKIVPVQLAGVDASSFGEFGASVQNQLEERIFTPCPNGKYVNDNCNGSLSIDTTPEQLTQQGNNANIRLTIVSSNGNSSEVQVAGENTEQALGTIAQASSGNSNGVDTDPTCESEGGIFSFILCPLLEWSSNALASVEGWITNRLQLPEDYYSNDGVRQAWANIRNIAFLILIPVLLVMVIATALGFNFLDAYTVKRTVPRLFFAIIFMSLSYDITRIMIEITNIVGSGIAGIIASPFGGTEALTLQAIFQPTNGNAGAILGGGVLVGIGIGAIGAVSIGILASYLFVAALSLLAIFFILVFRQMILLALIILSPMAIISWIFPGNDKLWKLWWSSFSKLLMLYPIIVMALVSGRAFASIVPASASGGIDSLITTLIKITAYIGPFFLIPALFKFAGGAFANLAGIVNNREKGLFDRQRKYRGDKRSSNYKKAAAGDRFGNTVGLRRFNRAVGMGFAAKRAGSTALRRGGISAAYGKATEEAAHEYAEKDPDFKAIAADDTLLRAANETRASDIANSLRNSGDQRFQNEATVSRTVAMILQAKKSVGNEAFDKASLIAKAKAGTYYTDFAEMAQEVNQVYGNDRQGAGAAIMAMRSASMSSGRVDLGGAGAGATLSTLQQLYDGRTANGAPFTAADATNAIRRNVVESQGPQAIAHSSMKPRAVQQLIPELQRRIQEAYHTHGENSVQFKRELAAVANLYDTMAQTSPQNADIVAQQLMNIDPAALAPGQQGPHLPIGSQTQQLTLQQRIENNRSDEAFLKYRREYNSQQQNQLNQQNQGPGGPPVTGPPVGGPPLGGI